jgi:hypothetical protein
MPIAHVFIEITCSLIGHLEFAIYIYIVLLSNKSSYYRVINN